jgi:integrase
MATFSKTPSGSHRALIRRSGWPTVSKNFRLKRDAESWARRTEDEMDRGIFVDRSKAERSTLEEALNRYLKEVTTSKAKETIRTENFRAKQLIKHLGKYSLAALTPDIISKYRDMRLNIVKPNTVRLELALLSHLFTIAMQEWHIGLAFNPVAGIRKPPAGKGRERRLSKEEEPRLLDAVDLHPNPMLGWIVRLALETAMRKSEIVSLRKQDINISKRTILLIDTKNGETRTIPMSLEAERVLNQALNCEERPKDTNFLFFGEPGRDGKRRPYIINKIWAQALKRANIEGLTFHDLRHEATSRLVELGLSDQEVSAITGHKSMQMLKRYTHLRTADLVQRLDSLSRQ